MNKLRNYTTRQLTITASSSADSGATNIQYGGGYFEVQLDGEGLGIPKDAEGVEVAVTNATVWFNTSNIIEGVNDTIYVFGDNTSAGTELFTVKIAEGLYGVEELNASILLKLEALGARTLDGVGNYLPLISLSGDNATQKIILRFNYTNVYVDFSLPTTFREIIGFDALQYGAYAGAPLSILAPNVAAFDRVNYYLIHSNLVSKGIRFNNQFNQTIGRVLIDVPPNKEIVSAPFNPPKSHADNLSGSSLRLLRFWLTDDKQRYVNTRGESFPWTAEITITYKH